MIRQKRIVIRATLIIGMLLPLLAVAQLEQLNVTPEQVAKFKALNRSEQEAIAKAAGVPLPTVSGGGTEAKTVLDETIEKGAEAEKLKSQARKELKEDKESGLPLFGYDIFSGFPTSFTPIADLPVPSDYIVGPGDELTVQLYGKDNEYYRLPVRRDGFIDFPKLGPVSIAGKSFSQVQEDLKLRIKKQIIGVEASIGLGELRLMQVYVLGEAFQPGAYNISSLSTATQALIATGGIKTSGSLRRIQIYRNKQLLAELDLYALLLRGDRSQDVRLQSGDVVFVPPVGSQVAADGEIKRPAVYEILPKTNLSDILEIAGGPTTEAYLNEVRVNRLFEDGRRVLTPSLNSSQGRRFTLLDGDNLKFTRSTDELVSAIKLSGAFVRPGLSSHAPNARISDIIGNPSISLRQSADLSLALLIRENDNGKISVLYLPLEKIQAQADHPQNYLVQAKDEIIVLPTLMSHTAFKGSERREVSTVELEVEESGPSQRIDKERRALIEAVLARLAAQVDSDEILPVAEVRGDVRFPGIYPYTTDLTVEKLIAFAGGMLESAEDSRVELARLEKSHLGSQVVKNYVVQADEQGSFEAVTLQPRDRINVFRNPDWRNDITVTIEGEVLYPGRYSLQRGETLSELVARAGGFTDFAYPRGAILSREKLKEKERIELQRLRNRMKEEVASLSLRKSSPLTSPGLSVSPGEALKIVDELGEIKALGRLAINLPAAVSGEKSQNIKLEDGDRLVVPAHSNTVTLVGEVQYPSSHVFESGLNYKDYLERAGGPRKRADEKRIYIIRANGQVTMPSKSWFGTKVEEGDTIVVPIDTDYTDQLTLFSTATQILYQLGVGYSAIKD